VLALQNRTHIRLIVTSALACVAAFVFDHWTYDHIRYAGVYDTDWGRLLRVMGFWPTWVAAAFALYLHERSASPLSANRAILLVTSPGLAGIACEALKLLLRRERPEAQHGEYVFRAFSDRPFSSAGIGMPSSHAVVAFGAAAMLTYLFPRARWVWFALACGCALTRVLARAHYLSDVTVGAIVAISIARWLQCRYGDRTPAARDSLTPPQSPSMHERS
jgi:membrane-associated phospholipid phosphatase